MKTLGAFVVVLVVALAVFWMLDVALFNAQGLSFAYTASGGAPEAGGH
ncbi:MAG: hypothetical protein HY880_03990 [Deltaproteobacteria bacterium]|nr:hypothetical protein [Deltaproteobacteria bacterium]